MVKKKFQAIFFDNDGLLVDTESLYLKSSKKILASVGVEISEEWYVCENLGKGKRSFDLAREKGIPEDQVLKLMKDRDDLYEKMLMENTRILEGVTEVLEKLKGKFMMGVVTSSPKNHFDVIMERTNLKRFFDFFITRNDIPEGKPNPELYLKAIQVSGIPKEQCLVLEDSSRGVQAAKAAGLTCYAIPEPWARAQDFRMADRILGSIKELPEILL